MLMRYKFLVVLLMSVVLTGCLAPTGNTPEEKRLSIQNMKEKTLTDLYRQWPSAEQNISRSDGYAVFSNVSGHLLWFGGTGGYGVTVDQSSQQQTYMRMSQIDVGFGLGVQDIRVIFVFHSRRALDNFLVKGWEFGAQFDVAAKSAEKGGAFSGEVSISPEVDVYTLTETGIVAKINLAETKYWKDSQLNAH